MRSQPRESVHADHAADSSFSPSFLDAHEKRIRHRQSALCFSRICAVTVTGPSNGALFSRAAYKSPERSPLAVWRAPQVRKRVRANQPAAQFPSWMTTEGAPMRAYGQPSKFEEPVKRFVGQLYGKVAEGAGASFTPLQSLNGTLTPNGLHFERHHNGVPDIDPARHKLLIHGLVRKPLAFDVAALMRYPMVSRRASSNAPVTAFATHCPKRRTWRAAQSMVWFRAASGPGCR